MKKEPVIFKKIFNHLQKKYGNDQGWDYIRTVKIKGGRKYYYQVYGGANSYDHKRVVVIKGNKISSYKIGGV